MHLAFPCREAYCRIISLMLKCPIELHKDAILSFICAHCGSKCYTLTLCRGGIAYKNDLPCQVSYDSRAAGTEQG